jgi:hypothetical protein
MNELDALRARLYKIAVEEADDREEDTEDE